MSTLYQPKYSNYNCTICRESGRLPNAGGGFYRINDNQFKCNGCNQVFCSPTPISNLIDYASINHIINYPINHYTNPLADRPQSRVNNHLPIAKAERIDREPVLLAEIELLEETV